MVELSAETDGILELRTGNQSEIHSCLGCIYGEGISSFAVPIITNKVASHTCF